VSKVREFEVHESDVMGSRESPLADLVERAGPDKPLERVEAPVFWGTVAATAPQAPLGVVLILGSLVVWASLPVVPFLPISGAAKWWLSGGLVVAAELTFWLGVVLAGPAVVSRMRAWTRGKLMPGRGRAQS